MSKRPPKGYILESMAAARMTWKAACAEWIDNALDANATSVDIVAKGKRFLSIKDNGNGCADPQVMCVLGDHKPSGSTKLGRYGIGGKDSGLWVGGVDSTYEIKTVHLGKRRVLRVNWRRYGDSDWDMDDPTNEPAAKGEQGTHITVSPIVHKFPESSALNQLLDDLGYMYSPALKKGAQISFQTADKSKLLLKRWTFPRLREGETVDTKIEVNGKGARVYCGIVEDGESNPRLGLTYFYKYRVIIAASSLGCGAFNPARICGLVELDDLWKLTKHKDDIVDSEELFKQVYEAILPVLRRAEELGMRYVNAAFQDQLTADVNEALGRKGENAKTTKAKREPGEETGTVQPTNSERKHRKAARVQPGDRFSERDAGSIHIRFDNLGGHELGRVSYPNVVLNLDNEFVAQENREHHRPSLVLASLSLINGWRFFEPKSKQLPLFIECKTTENLEDFSRSLGELIQPKKKLVNKQ